jgi:acyl carrier protein
MSDIETRARKIVAEHLAIDADRIIAEAGFLDDLGADSLDTVELVMAFEEEFGIEISDEKGEHMHTFGDAVKLITELYA